MTIETPNGQLVIKPYHIQWLTRLKLTLNHMAILENMYNSSSMLLHPEYCEAKESKLLQNRYLITDGQISEIGERLLQDLYNLQPSPLKKIKISIIQEVDSELERAWEAWWEIWPQTKSVEGTVYVCGKAMKKDKLAMRSKYMGIIASKVITVEQMKHAATVYIEGGKRDSIRRGRNEMEYLNGMEPWLNQKQYLNWMKMPMPVTENKSSMFTEA